jgi:YD repeat-containing protein
MIKLQSIQTKDVAMRFIKAVICLFLCSSEVCFSQTTLPQVIPPSPQSKAFQRYGEYPVNYNIGVPDISIPLYTVKAGDLEIPIILRYYASGIKPNDPDLSNIGSGWTLDYGGQVNRTVEGKADELFAKPNPMKTPSQINQENLTDVYYLDNILEPTYGNDSRYDRFSYSLGDRHGSFAIDDDGSGNFTAYSYPFVPYKINVHTAAPTDPKYYRSISGIDIKDDKGINYQFGYNNSESANDSYNYNVTGWYLEKVSNPANTNQVNFTYADIPTFGWGISENSVQIFENGEPGDNGVPYNGACQTQSFGGDPQGHNAGLNYTGISYQTKNISSITFPNGYIIFNLDASKMHITSMVIYNNQNIVLKTVTFNRDNFPNSTNQFRLKSLQVSGTDGAAVQQYIFSYDETMPVADNRCLIDQWGYCRGEAAINTLTTVTMQRTVQVTRSITSSPSNSPPYNITVGDQVFTPNVNYMTRFVLNKIQYPTGGTTQFVYEGNQYFDVSNQTGGGLRIKQIISNDGQGNIQTKSYEYQPGFLEYPLSNILYATECGFRTQAQCQVCSSSNCVDLYYSFRTRTLVNGWNSNLGSNNVYYNNVTEYTGDGTTNNGKTTYTYTYENPNQASISAISSGVKGTFMPNYYMQTYKNWGNGLLKTKSIYKNTGSGNYLKIQDSTNNYQFVNLKTLSGLYVYIVATYNGYGNDLVSINIARNDFSTHTQPYMDKSLILQGASVNTQNIVTGAYYLASTVENNYDGTNALTINTTYEHNNPNHYYPTKIIKDISTGESHVTSLAYVDEFSTDPVYSAMKTLNIYAPVIEKKEFIKNTANVDRLVSGSKINYAQWNSLAEYYPQTVQTSTAGSNYDTRIIYNGYDNLGNVNSVSKANAPAISYHWGYNGEYPVAECKNAANDEFFSENFEALSGAVTTGGHTGHNYFSGSYTTSDKLSPGYHGRTYVISYWYNNGSQWVYSGLLNYTGQTLTGNIDDVRIYPIDAQLATYTYDPLIGTTSSTDAKGETTYYEYDSFQRLRNIKDRDGNILKNYCYNYAGQQTGCPVNLGNMPKSGAYNKACNPGSAGSLVTYAVPANTYFASTQTAADQLAQNDVNANGQNYANAKGTCTVITSPYVVMRQASSMVDANGHTQNTYTFTAYADAANTTLFAVAANLTVNYKITTTVTHSSGSPAPSTTSANQTIVIPVGSNHATTGQIDVYHCTGGSAPAVVQQSVSAQSQQTRQAVASPNVIQPGDTICTSSTLMLLAGTGYQIGGGIE